MYNLKPKPLIQRNIVRVMGIEIAGQALLIEPV